jgi:hypothetical protein
VHPKIVQERMGHSTIATNPGPVQPVTPGLQEAAALRFDEGLAPVNNVNKSPVLVNSL